MSLKPRQFVLGSIIGLVALLLPGQNYYQVIKLSPSDPVFRTIEAIDVPPAMMPVKKSTARSFRTTARGAIVVDVDSGAVLFEHNPDTPLLPASTTKIMTTLVALQEYDLDEIVTVDDAYLSIGHTAELQPDEQLTVRDLLKAMMIPSGNDAALALGQHHPEGYSHFVSKMNEKARELHLTNTHYRNVSGVESYGHESTPRDLALLTKEAMKNKVFRDIVGTRATSISSVDGTITHSLTNLNELLGTVEGVQGVKTGWTENAGECLVTYTERQGHSIIAVILGSGDRFGESRQLIEWTYASYTWIDPVLSL